MSTKPLGGVGDEGFVMADGIVDALYSRFLLRDVFAKVVPGAIVLLVIVHGLIFPRGTLSETLEAFEKLPAVVWLVLLGTSWIMGFAVQSFAESRDLISLYPTPGDASDSELKHYKKGQVPSSGAEFHETVVRFRENHAEQRDLTQQHERFVVIREACGNGYVSLFVAVAVYLLGSANYFLAHHTVVETLNWGWEETRRTWPYVLVLLAACHYLRRMHRSQVDHQWQLLRPTFELMQREKAVASKREGASSED